MVSLPPDVWAELNYSGTWNDISRDVRATAAVSVSRGADGESSAPGPMAGSCTLDNRHRKFSPRDPGSDLFQLIGQNTGIRYGVKAGGPWAAMPGTAGAKLTTPDSASLAVTDVDLRVDMALEDWSQQCEAAGRYVTAGDQRSWALLMATDGQMSFYWSPNGTLASRIVQFSTENVRAYNGQRLACRITLDVNNGAGGYTLRFYTGRTVDDDEMYWTQLGDPITGGATTSVHDGSAGIELGEIAGLADTPMNGRLYAFKLLSGIGAAGTVVASMTTADAGVGAASFTSGGAVWTVEGTATLTNKHVRMAGEVPAWPPGRDESGNNVYTEIEPAGITRRLGAGGKPVDSALLRYIKAQGPLECWPLTDGEQSVSGGALYGSKPMLPSLEVGTAQPEWGGGTLADWIEPVVQLPAETDGTMKGTVGDQADAAAGWAVDFFYAGAQDLEVTIADRHAGTDADPRVGWTISLAASTNQVQLTVVSVGDTTSSVSSLLTVSSAGVFDKGLHHFRLNTTASGANAVWNLYIDGVARGTGTATGYASRAIRFIRPGWFYASVTSDTPAIGYVTYWGASEPDAADVWAAASGWSGESAGERAERVAAEAGVTLSVAGPDDGQVLMGIQRRQTLLEILETCATSDDGFFLERRDAAELVYRAHTALENQAPAFVLDFRAGMIRDYKATDDDKNSLNDVTVRREGGTVNAQEILETGRKSVLDPPDGIGRYDDAFERNVETDELAANLAGWYLHKGTYDGYRFPKITLDLANERVHQMIDHILRADVGDIIRMVNVPDEYGPDAIDLIIRGYEEEMSEEAWRITFSCAPGAVWTVATVAADDPAHDGPACRADTNSTLTSSITATATSFQVTCPGATWIDSAAFASEFPFDVRVGGVGGEVMRVTAVASATSPQTFTVTRGINGYSRAWSAGADVRLAVTPIVPL